MVLPFIIGYLLCTNQIEIGETVSTVDKEVINILFIIDPQNDFHPGGTLGVPGANEDSARIADFIRTNIDAIDEIYVSLDSHHRIHIAHGVFWKNNSGEHPPPFTLIHSKDVATGRWSPVDETQLINRSP